MRMPRLRGFENREAYRGGVLSIGNFDGVHRGHRKILAELVQQARSAGVPAVVLTFEPHPLKLLSPERFPPRLSTPDRKAELLEQAGVDVVIEYPTDSSLLNLSPDDFFRTIILEELNARGLVEGPNFHFGKERAGTIETLQDLCGAHNRFLTVVAPFEIDGAIVSSSQIRQRLAAGDIAEAARLLGRDYELSGTVSRGAGRGRQLGVPTVNLTGIETLVPADGVYSAWRRAPGGDEMAAVNIGPNPTFGDTERKVEAHLLDYHGDLYGTMVTLAFVDRIRPSRAFATAEELQLQLGRDIARVREQLAAR